MYLADGLRPDRWGSLSAPPEPLATIRGYLLLKGRGEEEGEEKEGREREGRLASHAFLGPEVFDLCPHPVALTVHPRPFYIHS